MTTTIRVSQLVQFELQIFREIIDQHSLCLREPESLPHQNVPDIPISQFSDEREPRQAAETFAVRNGRLELVRITVLLNQGIPDRGGQQDQHKVSSLSAEQDVLLKPAILPQSHSGIANQLI